MSGRRDSKIRLRRTTAARRTPRSSSATPRDTCFELAETLDQIAQRNQRLDRRDIDQRAVEHEPRLQGLAELVATPEHALEHLRHARPWKLAGLGDEVGALFIRRLDETRSIRRHLQHRQIAQIPHDRASELNFVDTAIDRLLDGAERSAGIAFRECANEASRQRTVRDTEDLGDVSLADRRVTDERDDLIAQR